MPSWLEPVASWLVLFGIVAAVWLGRRKGRRLRENRDNVMRQEGAAAAAAALSARIGVTVSPTIAVGSQVAQRSEATHDELVAALAQSLDPVAVRDALAALDRAGFAPALGLGGTTGNNGAADDAADTGMAGRSGSYDPPGPGRRTVVDRRPRAVGRGPGA